MAVLYNAFGTSVGPLGDAITLQYIQGKNIKFSSIRLVGTISYAVMAALAGMMLADDVRRIFFINAAFLGAALIMIFFMPNIPKEIKTESKAEENTEKQADKPKSKLLNNLKTLFSNKMIVCIFASSFVFGITMTFYHSFVGIRLKEIGATNTQVGIALFISAASEIPVLLIINKVFGKIKPVHLLMMVGLIMGFRMVLMYIANDLYLLYAAQLLHGLTFMVHYYFCVVLLNEHSPSNMKSTVQSVHAMIRGGAASLLGNVGGGFLAQRMGFQNVYLLLAGIVTATCFLLPAVLLAVYKFRNRPKPI
jgi:PPP family 3-phenylpropionic acid transporter